LSIQTNSKDPLAAAQPHRKWSLTQEAFDRLLACLADDREAAGEKYLEIRRNLIRFFEWRGCPFPEDHADETVNRVARRLSEGEELRNPSAYFIGVARLLVLEIVKARAKESQALEEVAFSTVEPVEPTSDEPRIECLQQCLGTLESENRELILQYYQGEKGEKIRNRRQLTTRLGVPLNTLRMRALRLRERLQGCVEQCVSETGV
jgi:DNA-directed RNA polymerase specialized sigma24 family protein